MVSTILSPKASEIMLQPTLTTAISAAANSPSPAPQRHRVGRLAFEQPADHVADQRRERRQDDQQQHRVAPVDPLGRDEVGGGAHARLLRDEEAQRSATLGTSRSVSGMLKSSIGPKPSEAAASTAGKLWRRVL